MKENYALMASVSFKDGIKGLEDFMKEKLSWSTVVITESTTQPNHWVVANGNGKVDGMRVVFKKGRYKLERLTGTDVSAKSFKSAFK